MSKHHLCLVPGILCYPKRDAQSSCPMPPGPKISIPPLQIHLFWRSSPSGIVHHVAFSASGFIFPRLIYVATCYQSFVLSHGDIILTQTYRCNERSNQPLGYPASLQGSRVLRNTQPGVRTLLSKLPKRLQQICPAPRIQDPFGFSLALWSHKCSRAETIKPQWMEPLSLIHPKLVREFPLYWIASYLLSSANRFARHYFKPESADPPSLVESGVLISKPSVGKLPTHFS